MRVYDAGKRIHTEILGFLRMYIDVSGHRLRGNDDAMSAAADGRIKCLVHELRGVTSLDRDQRAYFIAR